MQSYKLKNETRKVRFFLTYIYKRDYKENIFREEIPMNHKSLSFIISFMCCMSVPVQTSAADTKIQAASTTATEEIQPRTEGLILDHSLSCTRGTKTIYITAKTTGFEEMAEIGCVNILIQRSSNLTNWVTEKTISDKIATNANYHLLDNYPVTVQGGYYYRVQLTHYAKEDALFFPDEQAVVSFSSSIWIS